MSIIIPISSLTKFDKEIKVRTKYLKQAWVFFYILISDIYVNIMQNFQREIFYRNIKNHLNNYA